ncbi:MAG: diguanylate cyclase [Candidatus Omnitrophica bacterium]|nr:diguanylate cyclase [Candidatus Omnitrophota bacterium]
MENGQLDERTTDIAQGIQILVIDDEEIMRNMLRDVLSDAGYQVVTAANGLEAIEKFKERDFNIVITDIRMPGIDGVEVTRKFKSLDSNICVIAITGYASIDSAIAILKEGAYDYINKPFNIDEIKIVVGRAAERQKLLKEAKEKEKYRQLSIFDGLTEVYNRRYFDEIAPKEVARAKRYKKFLTLFMVDIDHFKNFNDTHGHQAGDWALKRIAQLLLGNIRSIDYIFRYGGEEFAIILPETNKINSLTVARRLRLAVSLAKFLDKKAMPNAHITISIGVANYPDDAEDINGLIAKADECLYHAKELGRDRICFLSVDDARKDTR